jgi:hypothetical protein
VAETPKSKAELRDRFVVQLNKSAESADTIFKAFLLQGQRRWHIIDLSGISKAFSREENEEDVANAIKDGSSPGTTGDLIVSVLQGDYLAAQERAFRMRHQTPVRSAIHSAARRMGHAHDKGVFKRGVKGVIENILKQSKGNKAS